MLKLNKYYLFSLIALATLTVLVGGHYLYLSFFMLIFMFMFSFIYILIAKNFIETEIVFKRDYYCTGDESQCITKINFDFAFPVPFLKIYSEAMKYSIGELKGEVTNMTADENKWIKSKILFNKRGLYNIGKYQIEISDIFKIFTYVKKEDRNINIKVYPRIYKIDSIANGGKDIFLEKYDKHSTNEEQSIIRDVRKYRMGDSLKKVHWKISAKLGDLYVKNTETISGEQYVVLVDMNKNNYAYEESLIEERVVEFAASVVNYLSAREINADVYLNKKNIEVKQVTDRQSFNEFMEYIIMEKSDGELSMQEFIYSMLSRIHRSNKLLLVLPELSKSIVESVISLKDNGYDIAVFCCIKNFDGEEQMEKLQRVGISCMELQDIVTKAS